MFDFIVCVGLLNSEKYVFYTTSPKKAVLPSTVAKQIDEAWNQGGNSKSFSCTKWRKSVVTAVSNHLTGNRFCLHTFVLLLVLSSGFNIFVVNSINDIFS